MRIALSTGVLFVPPLYFSLNHAEKMKSDHEFRMFTLLGRVTDPEVTIPVESAVPMAALPVALRQAFIPFSLPALASRIRRFQPDLVHQHFATWSTPAITAATRNRVPLITTLHGYDAFATIGEPTSAMSRWHRRNVTLTQRHSTRVLAVSRYLADQAVSGGFDSSRLSVHYQGVDTDFFSVVERSEASDPIILFVGALSALKGVRDLVAASAALCATMPHRLVLVGQGPLERELRAANASMPHMQLLGRLNRMAIRDLMQQAKVLVLPTQEYRGRREAAGLVLLEAQACGTPVVAYDSGGTSEMLEKDASGLLVPEKNRRELGEALRAVLALDSAEYQRMRASARRFVEQNRSLAASCDELEQHYLSAVS